MNGVIIKQRLKQGFLAGCTHVWYALGGTRLGLPWRKRFSEASLIGQLRTLRPAPVTARANPPLRIVFFTMMGSHSYLTAADIAWARALRQRGHHVSLVLCDQALPLCENKPLSSRDRWPELCDKCFYRGQATLDASGLPYDLVARLAATPLSAEELKLLDGLDFSYVVESSLYKYLRVGRLGQTVEEAEATGAIQQSCRTVAQAALILARQKPDRVIMSHGVYSTWAPALMVCNALRIPVAVYNKGKRRTTAVINWVDGQMDWDVSRAWEQIKETPLTVAQEERIREYLGTRVRHSGDALRYNFGEVETREQFFQRFRLDPAKQTFVLFTNVLWDAASAQKEIAFRNAVDWVMETIAWFLQHPEIQLVVKIHPAEVVIGTNQPFAREIARKFPQLPENIRIIEPSEKINSWTMTEVATAALVHTSTPGLEMPLAGVPSIIVSQTHYRGKGFTVDVTSREEYFHLLGHWRGSPIPRERMQALALRYAWLLFECYHLSWSFLLEGDYGRVWAIDVDKDEDLAANATLQFLCHCVEQRSEFLLPNQTPPVVPTAVGQV
jgi:hypothetical protein